MEKVIFRKFKDGGDIVALLPDNPTNPGKIDSYMHIGQHGEATRDIVSTTTLATVEEYSDLLEELKSIGYDLIVMRRLTN